MQVFISWSGKRSQQVAVALREWLPCVLQGIKPFMSSQDISAGVRWQQEIASHLAVSKYGIVCVTRENQDSAWLNFEAGALAKAVEIGRVVPLAVDLSPADVRPPLGQFQAKPANEDGMGEVVASANEACDAPLPVAIVEKSFEKWWPDLHDKLSGIGDASAAAKTPPPAPARTDRELLEELVNTTRASVRGDHSALYDDVLSLLRDYPAPFSIGQNGDGLVVSSRGEIPQDVQMMIVRRAAADGLHTTFLNESSPRPMSRRKRSERTSDDTPE